MSDYTNYANFNTFTVQGRISFSDVKSGRNGDFVSVRVISTLVKDGAEFDVEFTDSNGLLTLFNRGYLRSGAMVTLTGRLQKLSETYTNQSGELQMRLRPLVEMTQVQIMTGGLGPIPKKDGANNKVNLKPQAAQQQAAPQDSAPDWSMGTEIPEEAGVLNY